MNKKKKERKSFIASIFKKIFFVYFIISTWFQLNTKKIQLFSCILFLFFHFFFESPTIYYYCCNYCWVFCLIFFYCNSIYLLICFPIFVVYFMIMMYFIYLFTLNENIFLFVHWNEIFFCWKQLSAVFFSTIFLWLHSFTFIDFLTFLTNR